MGVKSVLKHIVPGYVRRPGWQGYYHVRDHWLKTIVGCDTTRKVVALTFDDGPNPDATSSIVEILARYQVRATFFFLGRQVAAYPNVARQVFEAGHVIGNHTFTHRRLVGCSPMTVARELLQCQRAIREAVGVKPKLMRPPFGAQDATAFLTALLLGYPVVNWTASGDDWKGDLASQVAERVLADVQPGRVILLHDGWEPPPDQTEWRPEHEQIRDRAPTIEALSRIIESLRQQDYQFVTLPEMFQIGSPARRSWFVDA